MVPSIGRYQEGFSMLAKAAQNNHSNTMEALLANGADPNISRTMGVSTIWWTAFKKNVKMFLLFSYASAANLANQWPEKLGHTSQKLQSFIVVARFMSFEEMPNTWEHLLPDIPPDQRPNILQMIVAKMRFNSVRGTVNACPAQNSWNELSKQNHEHL